MNEKNSFKMNFIRNFPFDHQFICMIWTKCRSKKPNEIEFFVILIYSRHIEFNIEFKRKQQFVTCGRCFTNWINLWCTLHVGIFIWNFSIQQIISLMILREMHCVPNSSNDVLTISASNPSQEVESISGWCYGWYISKANTFSSTIIETIIIMIV